MTWNTDIVKQIINKNTKESNLLLNDPEPTYKVDGAREYARMPESDIKFNEKLLDVETEYGKGIVSDLRELIQLSSGIKPFSEEIKENLTLIREDVLRQREEIKKWKETQIDMIDFDDEEQMFEPLSVVKQTDRGTEEQEMFLITATGMDREAISQNGNDRMDHISCYTDRFLKVSEEEVSDFVDNLNMDTLKTRLEGNGHTDIISIIDTAHSTERSPTPTTEEIAEIDPSKSEDTSRRNPICGRIDCTTC